MNAPTPYELFVRELGVDRASPALAPDDVEAFLKAIVASAQAAWPELPTAATDFAAHLARHARNSEDVQAFLKAVHAEDVYLALACAQGNEAAIRAFEERFYPDVKWLARRAKGIAEDDLKQILREKLFVSSLGKKPGVAAYSGRGTLKSWFRVLASRALVDLVRQTSCTKTIEESVLRERFARDDVELEHIRARYRPKFEQAVSHALSSLAPRDRTVLRQRFVDGLRLEELATAHAVDRATAVRWLAKARASVRNGVRDELTAELQLTASEFSSLVRLVRSELEVTLSELLS